jgi:hypothetical protein
MHRNTLILRGFKAHGCDDCGKRPPEVLWTDLHAHHVDPATKRIHFGNWTGHHWTEDDMLQELASNGLVLCRGCHHKRHRNGGGHLAGQQLPLFGGDGLAWRYAR